MTTKLKLTTVGLFLVLCISVVYCLPQAKYTGKAITAEILDSIPKTSRNWQSRHIDVLADNLDGEVYNFVSRIFARLYVNKTNLEQKVFLVVLDAGNFHYPKVCFQGTGFSPEELPPRELNLQSGRIKTHLLLNKKGEEEYLSIYWICIDEKVVPTWAEQKVKQLFYSLFNKEKVGLMVRVDIPVIDDREKTIKIAESFLSDIYRKTPQEYRDYIFGTF